MTSSTTRLSGRCSSASRTAGSAAWASTRSPRPSSSRLARQFGPRVLRSPHALDRVRDELDEYFAGHRQAFDLELDLRALLRAAQFDVTLLFKLGIFALAPDRQRAQFALEVLRTNSDL